MDFESEVSIEGITVYRYRPSFDAFAMDNPNNFCFCPEFLDCAERMKDKDEWNITGCMDVCKDGMLKVSLLLLKPKKINYNHYKIVFQFFIFRFTNTTSMCG